MNDKLNTRNDAVGIDLGGTFLKFVLLSENGEIISDDKIAIDGEKSRENIFFAINSAINSSISISEKTGGTIRGIGIGTPGIVCEGVVVGGADNFIGWENVNLKKILFDDYQLPVFVDNDANVMGLGEVAFGAARNCTDVIFITIGTGIGGAIFINGELYSGYKNRGSELGHIVVEHNGIDCNCGGRGCLEAYASTSALIRHYAKLSGKTSQEITGEYIISKYHDKEIEATKCLNLNADYLGHGIAAMVNVFSPQKVVIGGGISEAGQFYIDMIKNSAHHYAMPDCMAYTDIVGAKLGNLAGSLGAASLVFR